MNLLETLIFKGTAEKKFSILDGKLNFTLKSLTGKDQLAVEEEMATLRSNPTFVVHKYSIKLLSRSLISYQDNDLSEKIPADVEEFIESLSTAVIDVLTKKQSEFQKECEEALSVENLENLSETQPVDSASK